MSGRILWNEGRVVGLSAYEIFVRHVLGRDPNATVPSELAWLTSVMSNGSALLLQIGSDTGSGSGNVDGTHYIDVELPSGSGLWATNTIVGSCFIGTGGGVTTDYTGWCTKVVDYGPLIQNDSTASPTTATGTPPNADVSNIPPTTAAGVNLTDLQKSQMLEYAKIVDGIVYQPGTWSENTAANKPPEKKEVPNASYLPHIRILLKDKVTTTFYVLLTGFTYKGVFDAIADYSHQGTQPENGDFLGPESWAWANKIVFTAPSNLSNNTTTEVVDLANWYLYNTKYVWPYRMGSAGSRPTQEQLKDVRTFNGVQVVSGYVSKSFISTYCVSYDEAMAACALGKLSDSNYKQQKYIDQIVAKYGSSVAANNYVYFFQKSTSPIINEDGQQGKFWAVESATGRLFMTIASAETNVPTLNADRGFNFSGSDITVGSTPVPKASTDIMGSYWTANDISGDLGMCTDFDGTDIFDNPHPLQNIAIKDYSLFGEAQACVPLPDSSFGYDFVDWLSNTSIIDVINSDPTKATQILDSMGIHSTYRNLDAQSFFQYAVTERDMRLPINTDYSGVTNNEIFYLFKGNDIRAIGQQSAWNPGLSYTATAVLTAEISVSDFFKPAKITATSYPDNEDITKDITEPNYHIWGSETTVGKSDTVSLSLVNNLGSVLPTQGTNGNISGDKINWDMILNALNQNKSIDILSDKISTNYVQLGNGLRLYISSTEPTDTDVPEGSVGLGWDGVKIYTSGAWT